MCEVPSAACAVIGWGPARANELVCWYRYFPLSAEGGIPVLQGERSVLCVQRCTSILRGERELSRGWAAVGLLRRVSWSLGEEQSRAEQVPATCLRVENTGAAPSWALVTRQVALLERVQQGLTHGAFGVARAGCCFIFVKFIFVRQHFALLWLLIRMHWSYAIYRR